MLVERSQFPYLKDGKVYVDWIGAALPPISLIENWHGYLATTLIGNPHSHHQPSLTAMDAIMETRAQILKYFNASPDEYEVVFSSGATAAILICQHYMFEGGELLLTVDNHNSVNGLREIARRNGAVVRYAPIKDDLTLDEMALTSMLSFPRSSGNRLFCYPAKSNYTGTIHDFSWIDFAQKHGWDVLLDAAAYVSNRRLDLGKVKPDFVPITFYKMFGFPTGVGCLIIKKSAYAKLHKKWFSGGSILFVSVVKDFFIPDPVSYARYEDGTVNFGMIPSVQAGLRFMESLGDIRGPIMELAVRLYDELSAIREGENSVFIHSARGNDAVTFSVRKGDKIVNAWEFGRAANIEGIFVRDGCFCNPGVNEKVFGYPVDDFERTYNDVILGHHIPVEELREHSGGKPIGAIRASFGYANNLADVQRFVEFTRKFLKKI